jgi:uncharacterized protein (TIGR02996 family)
VNPERRAFIDAIRANPDDDNVRLVYADWLQEQGEDDRAQYIRTFIAFVRGTAATADGLFGAYKCLGSKFGFDRENMPTMDRGLIRQVACTWQWWLDRGDRLLKTEWVPRVVLTTGPQLKREVIHSDDRGEWTRAVLIRVSAGDKRLDWKYVVSDREVRMARDVDSYLRDVIRYLECKTSPQECFKSWWPDTEIVTSPTSFSEVVNVVQRNYRYGPGPIADAVERLARNQIAPEQAYHEVAAEYGLRLPEDAARMSRVESRDYRDPPPQLVLCECQSQRFGTVVSNEDLVTTVDLHTHAYFYGNRRWRVAHGQCPHCRLVYFSVTPQPADAAAGASDAPGPS